MAKTKKIAKSFKTEKTVKSTNIKNDSFLSQFNWGDSYTSLFLGAVVVVVALILVFSFIKGRNMQNTQTTSTTTESKEAMIGTTYTVKEGDDLWTIAENAYGSGYNWIDIAQVNKLSNPSSITSGQKLSIPDVKKRMPEAVVESKEAEVITGVTYTVVKDDNLWDIAVRSYGDGFKWVEIAKANKLENPDLIHPGNKLSIPR